MRSSRHQSLVISACAKRLVEKFGYNAGAGDWWKTLGQENRKRPGWIEEKKLFAPLPRSFFAQPHRQPKFRERKACKSRMRAERKMEKCQHRLSAKRAYR